MVAVEVDRVTDEDQVLAATRRPVSACSCSSERPRPRPPEFFGRLLHKSIMVKITGAPSVSGTLEAFSPYELVVRDSRGRDVLLFKHSITSIDLPDGWRRTPGPEVETS